MPVYNRCCNCCPCPDSPQATQCCCKLGQLAEPAPDIVLTLDTDPENLCPLDGASVTLKEVDVGSPFCRGWEGNMNLSPECGDNISLTWTLKCTSDAGGTCNDFELTMKPTSSDCLGVAVQTLSPPISCTCGPPMDFRFGTYSINDEPDCDCCAVFYADLVSV